MGNFAAKIKFLVGMGQDSCSQNGLKSNPNFQPQDNFNCEQKLHFRLCDREIGLGA